MIESILSRFFNNKRLIKPLSFTIKMLATYGLWKVVSYFLETKQPIFWVYFQDRIAFALIKTSSFILENIVGYNLIYNSRNILIASTEGIYVADHCLGIPASFVFTTFILFFSGSWYHKIWFIPLGIFAIFCLNTIRLVALGVTQREASALTFYINHSYTFLLLLYGLIFLMILFWIEKFSEE